MKEGNVTLLLLNIKHNFEFVWNRELGHSPKLLFYLIKHKNNISHLSGPEKLDIPY